MLGDKQAGRTRSSRNDAATSIQRVAEWIPPDSTRFPSLDSASLQKSNSGSDPRPPSLPDAPRSSDTAPRSDAAQDLEVPDNGNPSDLEQGAILEQERERVRLEEVEPLRRRARALEVEVNRR